MPSLPYPPSGDYPTRMSRADGCPRACGNYTLPRAVRDGDEPGAFYADYRCEDCRHSWTTAWSDVRVEVGD